MRDLDLISRIARQLLEAADPLALIEELERVAADELGIDICMHRWYDADTGELILSRAKGIDEAHFQMEKVHMTDATICSEVASRREAMFAEHVQAGDDPQYECLRQLGVQAFCCLPLTAGERLVGTVLFATRECAAFTNDQRLLLQSIVDLFALSIRRAEQRDHQLASERENYAQLQSAMDNLRGVTDSLEQRVAQRTQDLVHYQTRLRSLVSELILTEQRERRRIAGDLHDHLAQLLVACKMKLALLHNSFAVDASKSDGGGDTPDRKQDAARRDGDMAAVLREVEHFLDESLGYTRSLVAQISPVLLYEQGLLPAIRWLAETVMPRHGLAVNVRAEIEPLGDQISEDVRIMLFESVRELLFNVLKHADVTSAEVTMRCRDQGLELMVTDKGSGFTDEPVDTEAADPHGFGLFSIRERMTLMGGRFELISTPGSGTRASVWVPWQRAAHDPEVLERDRASVRPPSRRDHGPASGHTRVMVVDDHAVVREGLLMMLGTADQLVVVGEADGGHSALDMVERLQPHVVLMDVSMPDMDGIETTSRLTSAHPGIKVIGLSMYEDDSVAASMRAAGAADYLCKGCSAEALVQAIHAAVATSHHAAME